MTEKSGVKLKKLLGLEEYENVYISFAYRTSPASFIVMFDSIHPRLPISKTVLRQFSNISLYNGQQRKYTGFSPPIKIEQFNGQLNRDLYIVYDTAYMRMSKNVNRESVEKGIEPVGVYYEGKISEFTIDQIMGTDNISKNCMKFRKERTALMGAENRTAKLIDCVLSKADNSVTFQWLTSATEFKKDDERYKEPKMEIPPNSFNLKKNPSRTYEMEIKILDFFDWIEAFEGSDFTANDLKQILKVSDVQYFSTQPSFHWSGVNYNASQLDLSIRPTTIAPTVKSAKNGGEIGWANRTKDAIFDKAMYGLARSLKFWINPMTSMLNKKLKDRGLI